MKVKGKEYAEWKSRVNVRDDFKCQECGKEARETHHIKSWRDFPELRFDVENGVTLCLDCHSKKGSIGRPKVKYGKTQIFYLSYTAIDKLKDDSHKEKKSMSAYVEDLIMEAKNG